MDIETFNKLNTGFRAESRLLGIFILRVYDAPFAPGSTSVYAQAPTLDEAIVQARRTCKKFDVRPPVTACRKPGPLRGAAAQARQEKERKAREKEAADAGRDYVADWLANNPEAEAAARLDGGRLSFDGESAAYDIAQGIALTRREAEGLADLVYDGMHKELERRGLK